jgi:ribosome-binding factor A
MSKNSRRTQMRHALSELSALQPANQPEDALGHRQNRLEHILRDEIQALIRDEATDPCVEGVALLSVHLSPDGGHARIAYAVVAHLEEEQDVKRTSQAGLLRATGFLRARLAQQLDLKKLPKLAFTFVGVLQPKADRTGGEPCPK